jgi:hypothetical protein
MESGFIDPRKQNPEAFLGLYQQARTAELQGHDDVRLSGDEVPLQAAVEEAYDDAGAARPRITTVEPSPYTSLPAHHVSRTERLKEVGKEALAITVMSASIGGAIGGASHLVRSAVEHAPRAPHQAEGIPTTTPEQAAARATLANKPLKNPAITSFRQSSPNQEGRSKLSFDLRVIDSPEGREVLTKYAHDSAVRWLTNGHRLVGKFIYKDKDGKHVSFIDGTRFDTGHFTPKDGKAQASLSLNTRGDALGTELALYTANTASTSDDHGVVDQTGYQSTHTSVRLSLEDGHRVWKVLGNDYPDMPGQPEVTPWQTPVIITPDAGN